MTLLNLLFPHLPFEIFRDLPTPKKNYKALRGEVWVSEQPEVDWCDLFRLNSSLAFQKKTRDQPPIFCDLNPQTSPSWAYYCS